MTCISRESEFKLSILTLVMGNGDPEHLGATGGSDLNESHDSTTKSSSSTLDHFYRVGKKIGLAGEALADFVKFQQNLDREERCRKRDHERSMAELEVQRAEIEKQRSDITSLSSASKSQKGSQGGPIPKLPKFNCDKDDIDSYLWRFENYARMRGWSRDSWAVYLGALLEGKSLEVYARLPNEHSQDYEKLKKALLVQFQMTRDGFKTKFHTTRQSKEETFSQFASRTSNYFDRWLDLSEVDKTFKGLRNFMVMERCLHNSPVELVTFIREHDVKSLEDAIARAEIYEAAHASKRNSLTRDKFKTSSNSNNNTKPQASKGQGQTSSTQGQSQTRTFRPGQQGSFKRCFKCGSPNHFKRDCGKSQSGNVAVVEDIPTPVPEKSEDESAE